MPAQRKEFLQNYESISHGKVKLASLVGMVRAIAICVLCMGWHALCYDHLRIGAYVARFLLGVVTRCMTTTYGGVGGDAFVSA